MGTKAVFAVESKPGYHYKKIIGMTSDGFPNNLNYIARLFIDTAREMRVLTKVKDKWTRRRTVVEVMEKVVEKESGWLFLDDVDNAQWVSHSAIFDPVRGWVRHFDGKLEEDTMTAYQVQATRKRK